jgi:hypothetical protein
VCGVIISFVPSVVRRPRFGRCPAGDSGDAYPGPTVTRVIRENGEVYAVTVRENEGTALFVSAT